MKILRFFSSVLTPFRTRRVLQLQARSLCQKQSTKQDKVALKELFPNLGHSNPEIRKMIEVMGEAKVPRQFAKLLDLKLYVHYGQFKLHKSLRQPDSIESVKSVGKEPFSIFGPESEASKIDRNWENLQFEVNLFDSRKVLLDLYKTLSEQRELCLMIGLYLSKDFGLLRPPHYVFNYFIRNFLFSKEWTIEEEQILMDNLTEIDEVLQQKIPSKNRRQIIQKKERMQAKQKAKKKILPFTLEEDLEIALFVLEGKMPKSLEEFRQISKGKPWTELSKSLKRTPVSLHNRFIRYIQPFIEAHILNADLKEEIVKFNHYLVQEKIPSQDMIDWNLFPLSKPFYTFNINLRGKDRHRKDEPVWSVVEDRNKRGKRVCKILLEDHGKAILKALT